MSFQNARIKAVAALPSDYHHQDAERGTPNFVVSPSSLKEFGRCPARWKNGYVSPDSKAKAWGSLIDALLLTPEQFDARYVLQPGTYLSEVLVCPSCGSESDSLNCRKCKTERQKRTIQKEWNNNSKTCQDWTLERLTENKEVIDGSDLFDARTAVARIQSDPVIKSILDASNMQVWLEGEWHDEPTGLVVPARCLLDFVPRNDTEWAKCLGDLKSVKSAALIPFQRQVYQYGWHIQSSFDTDLYVAATGEDRCEWLFIVQENYAPWQTGKRMLSQDFTDLGRAEYRRLLNLYCKCLHRNEWPDYDSTDEAIQGFGLVSAEPWMAGAGQFAPQFTFEDEEGETQPEETDIIP